MQRFTDKPRYLRGSNHRVVRDGGRSLDYLYYRVRKLGEISPTRSRRRRLVGGFNAHSRGYGAVYLVSRAYADISLEQLEMCRKFLRKACKKTPARVHMSAFAYVALTKKPSEVRMGKGKGSKIYKRVCPVVPGMVLCGVVNANVQKARYLIKRLEFKIGFPVRVI